MIIRELTEQEKKDAVAFMKSASEMTYEEFAEWKKENTWWSDLLLNWCRIRKDYPELNTIWETKFVLPDKQKKWEANKNKIIAEMSRKKAQFIVEHFIPEEEAKRGDFKYRIIHHTKVKWDECLVLAIPFDAMGLMVPKFWASVEIYKSQCPSLFDETLKTFKRYDGTAVCTSYSERYNKRN